MGTRGLPMIRSSAVCALTFAALTVAAASAIAQTRVQAGILQCWGAPTASFIVGSVHELGCVFQSDRGPRYRYYGVVRRVGLDISFKPRPAPSRATVAKDGKSGLTHWIRDFDLLLCAEEMRWSGTSRGSQAT